MDDDAIPAELLRALRYVDLVERGGGLLTDQEVDAFVNTPSPTSGPFGMWSTLQLYALIRGRGYAEYMRAVDWISGTGHVRLTDLGRAIVKGLRDDPELAPSEGEAATVLNPEDPMNLFTLTGAIAGARAGMLVDPYFKDDFFPWLIDSTSIRRVLLCRAANQRSMIELALGGAQGSGRDLEVRCLPPKEFHDRYLIAENGSVSTMGISLTGIRKHFSVITPIADPGASAIRSFVESEWSRAEPVKARDQLDGTTTAEVDPSV